MRISIFGLIFLICASGAAAEYGAEYTSFGMMVRNAEKCSIPLNSGTAEWASAMLSTLSTADLGEVYANADAIFDQEVKLKGILGFCWEVREDLAAKGWL